MSSEVPHVDVEIGEENLENGLQEVLTVIRPEWNIEHVTTEARSDGYCNKNFAVHYKPPPATPGGNSVPYHDSLFLRLSNPKVHNILERATKAMIYMKRRNYGAQILATFKNGLIMKYLKGDPITWRHWYLVKEPKIWKGIAKTLAKFHSNTNFEHAKELGLLTHEVYLKEQLLNLERCVSRIKLDMKSHGFPDPDELHELRKSAFDTLLQDGAEISFCHTDVNPTNFLLTETGPVLIDYDSCRLGFSIMDLAMLFVSTSDLSKATFEGQPTEAEQDTFLRHYLTERIELDSKFQGSFAFWKFSLRKALLAMYLRAVSESVLMQEYATREVDLGLARIAWERYHKNQQVLLEKFAG